jgi:transposase InsO family protein
LTFNTVSPLIFRYICPIAFDGKQGGYYLSVVLDDYSRYILSYTHSQTMKVKDAEGTLKLALSKAKMRPVFYLTMALPIIPENWLSS